MAVDEANDLSHTPPSLEGSDTGDAVSDHSETPPDAAPATGDGDAAATPEHGNSPAGRSSSATPNTIPQNPQRTPESRADSSTLQGAKPGEPQQDWQKRYSNAQSGWAREKAQIQAERQREAQELNQLRQFQQEQRAIAERAKLPVHSRMSPENAKFQAAKNKADVARQQLRNIDPALPPEQREAMRKSILSVITPEEEQMIAGQQQASEQFLNDLVSDPHSAIAPLVQPLIQQAFDQFLMHQRADAAVAKDFKELEPVLKAHGPEVRDMLARGTPYDVAIENARLKAQLESLQNRVGSADQARAAAHEQQRLAKGNAAITRDPAPTSKPDIYAMAKKEAVANGWTTDDPRFMRLLSKHEKNHPSA